MLRVLKIICAVWYILVGWIGWFFAKIVPGGHYFRYFFAVCALEFASSTKFYHIAW